MCVCVVGGRGAEDLDIEAVRERCERPYTQCGDVLGRHHKCWAHLFAHVKPCFKSTVRQHFRVDKLAISAIEASAQGRLQTGHCSRKQERVSANRKMSQSLADLTTHLEMWQTRGVAGGNTENRIESNRIESLLLQ